MATKQYEITVYLPHSHSVKIVVSGENHVEAMRAARATALADQCQSQENSEGLLGD